MKLEIAMTDKPWCISVLTEKPKQTPKPKPKLTVAFFFCLLSCMCPVFLLIYILEEKQYTYKKANTEKEQ